MVLCYAFRSPEVNFTNTESHFAKFSTCQSYLLYSIIHIHTMYNHINVMHMYMYMYMYMYTILKFTYMYIVYGTHMHVQCTHHVCMYLVCRSWQP